MLVNEFEKELGCVMDISAPISSSIDSWNSLGDAVNYKVVKTFGVSDKMIPDWFKAHIDTIGPSLHQKRMAKLVNLNKPSMENL